MHRHGLNNWDAVADQLNTTCVAGYGRKPPPYTAGGCRQRYLTIRKNFKINSRTIRSSDMDTLINLVPVPNDQGDKIKVKDQKIEEDPELFDEGKEKPLLETMMKEFNQRRQTELRMLIINGENAQVRCPITLLLIIHIHFLINHACVSLLILFYFLPFFTSSGPK